jgi:TolA-binding protein
VREQTSLVDAARDAVASGAADKALAFLRQYQDKYPDGIFRPEAAALKIEALARLGRGAEAHALANRFVAEYGDGRLTDRVRRVAGSTSP